MEREPSVPGRPPAQGRFQCVQTHTPVMPVAGTVRATARNFNDARHCARRRRERRQQRGVHFEWVGQARAPSSMCANASSRLLKVRVPGIQDVVASGCFVNDRSVTRHYGPRLFWLQRDELLAPQVTPPTSSCTCRFRARSIQASG